MAGFVDENRQWGINGFWGEISMTLGILRKKKEGELDLKQVVKR